MGFGPRKCVTEQNVANIIEHTKFLMWPKVLKVCLVIITMHQLNQLSTRPHQNVVWYNNSWLGFLKILNYAQKEVRETFSARNEPSFVTVTCCYMAHRNYFKRNNLQILKLATYTKIEDHYSRCKLARLERIAKCSYLYFVYPKHQVLLICNENKEISVANLMIQ